MARALAEENSGAFERTVDGSQMTCAQGAAPGGPARSFDASLDGGTRRVVDRHVESVVDKAALTVLRSAAPMCDVTWLNR